MRPLWPIAFLSVTAFALQGCFSSSSSSSSADEFEFAGEIDLSEELDSSTAGVCDHLVSSSCLYPFPSNHHTRSDDDTETGIRIAFDPDAMPVAQPLDIPPDPPRHFIHVLTEEPTPVDPTEWNRNDGFSPGAMLLAHFPELDLDQTGAVRITDIERSLDADAPILVINADSGERHLIWSELDVNASNPAGRALIIRPARNFTEGERYIVAMRNLRDAAGEPIEAGPLFRAYRDRLNTNEDVYEARRQNMEDIFGRLESHGVDRDELVLAWDFTVASQKSLTERLLHIRDTAFAHLGGGAPQFSVDEVGLEIDGSARDGLSRGITGTFEVPNFLNQIGGTTGSSFNYTEDDPDALPQQLHDDTVTARFRCQIADSTVADFDDDTAAVTPARAALYGHGLFGEGPAGETRSGNVRAMQNEHNIMFCATDWIGMAQEDFIAGTIQTILADISNLPKQLDRSQQGMLNFMFLAELLTHEDGFQSDPAFRHGPDNTLVYEPDHVFFDGNSQGGIKGGALVATAPNIHRGVLGVPGSNYSLLLRRYGPFNERFGYILYQAYQDELDRSLVFGLMQMLWDRAENNGYLSHLAGNHLPNTPTDKAVLLHVALGDYQVNHWSAEIMARTIGAAIHEPTARLGEHPDDNPYFAIPQIGQYPHQGHAIMIWDSGDVDPNTGDGNPHPPTTNTGPDVNVGNDPHSSPRSTAAAREQKSAFMEADGAVIDVCGATPCFSDDYTGISRD
ncbi:MAG: hypothetical protein LAT50_05825 [Ectothiorhodospiraceae bacterium]|nr:hypothetical protein [Ectothiorhodospiraceae bacterium]